LYYSALGRLDASLGHLLYSLYPLFVALWLWLDHQPLSRLTYLRLGLSLPGIILLILTGNESVDLLGAGLMIGASAFFALHLIINQRVLYEVPAPTVTLYTLLSMTAVVIPACILVGPQLFPTITTSFLGLWWPVLCLALVTISSRLTLFLGVKHLGGMQTALLGLGELFVTMVIARWWLGEQLSLTQWLGASLLGISLILIGRDKMRPNQRGASGWFAWLKPPEMRI
jgi:drug/metabolite transporter (DMT)-like permease